MTYDEVGNLETYTDFNGEVTSYDYDAQNRLELKDLENDIDVSYTYTPDGQIETITDSRGTTEFKYDELGRLLWRKDPDGEHLANGNTIEYQYDDAGNVTEIKTLAGTIEYEYDEWNRLEKVIEGTETTSYSYDELGNLERTEFPNGTVEMRTYDELYRLKVLEVKDVNDTVLAKYEYELSDAGYREQVKETLLQPDGTIVERTIDYDYDELYRLLEAAILGGEMVEYAYDDVGNRLSQTSSQETREYVYDENDRLKEERVNGVVVVTYSYDDNGNLKMREENGEEVHYLWDDQNRLVTVQTSTETIHYAYDDDNFRVSQTVGSETTSYLLDKNRPYAQVLAEYTNGNLDASYVYGLDLISQERNDVDSYYLVDGLGSTRGLTDENGNVTDVYNYDAYGNLIDSVGNSENSYLFAGEQFDENLDQYYLRQRYYDPSVGRFTRRDTYEGNNFDPITLHKYLYAGANPINYIDSSGFIASLAEFSTATALQKGAILALLTHSITLAANPPERLGGFGAGSQPTLDDLSPRPRDPRDSLLQRLLSYPGGFGAGQQPDLPTHTGHSPDNTIYDLIRYIFASIPDYINDPLSIWGKTAEEIQQEFEENGYEANIEQSTKGSKKSKQIRIKHPEISNIQVHPGGGRHITPYYKISTSTQGKIWVVPKDFKVDPGMKGTIVSIP
ncbi:RHS repeat domain-containing protein [Spirulina sp. 06S082]|uniref:RHS repeat domain-containing protein n=1 Tax=Spirulina sp. 06S082 TaxID=3110248 RepID=UPI003A4DA05B